MTYVQLAHNVWDTQARCAKAQVLHTFGRTDDLDTEALKRLAKSIGRFLTPEDAHRIQTNGQRRSSSAIYPQRSSGRRLLASFYLGDAGTEHGS